jgi:hypothetical protein
MFTGSASRELRARSCSKIYADEPQWIVAKEPLVAGWIGRQAGLPIPRWLRVDESRTRIPFRFALTTWLPGGTVRSLIGAPGIDAAYRQMGALLRRLHAIPHECLRLHRRRRYSAAPIDER